MDNLNKTVTIDLYDSIYFNTKKIAFKKFRGKYNYISIVYLETGCHACYDKYANYQLKMDSISTNEDYAILFIILGEDYKKFMKNVNKIRKINTPCYIMMDRNYYFLSKNKNISQWTFNSTILVNRHNKIKLIGAPFATPEMTELFHKICDQ